MPEVLSINPYNGKEIARYTTHSKSDIDAFLKKGDDTFLKWRTTSFQERAQSIMAVRKELLAYKEAYAEVMTQEMGKPIGQAIAEIEKCAWLCEYYAENAEKQLSDEIIDTDADTSFVRYEPIGIVLAVMPWNYPFWQVFRFAIPALMAGNVAVLKHASNVFGSALAIEEVFTKAGLPEGAFKTLLIKSDLVSDVIRDPRIKAVTLTGSGPAGAAVASEAAQQIKKSVLELGGNNALIVLDDCDVEATVKTCVQARFQNTGQSCIACKRLLIQEEIYEPFVRRLLEEVRNLSTGDPLNPETYLSCLAREDLAIELESQVEKSIQQGATLALGGTRKKAFYEPTIVLNVSPDMPMFSEETFGPALGVTTFRDISEAIELSNRSRFGLGVSIFTQNPNAVLKYIPQFEEGAVFINELVKSDPRLPFGGVKESGFGRELSQHGIKEFTNVKTVYLKK